MEKSKDQMVTVPVRMPPKMKRELKREAKAETKTLSLYVREIIMRHFSEGDNGVEK